jgi:hypothetical protein
MSPRHVEMLMTTRERAATTGMKVDLQLAREPPVISRRPMPARYVIGTVGVIAYAELNPDYTQRPGPQELLPVVSPLTNPLAT